MGSSARIMVRTCNGLELRDPALLAESSASELVDSSRTTELFPTLDSHDEFTPRWEHPHVLKNLILKYFSIHLCNALWFHDSSVFIIGNWKQQVWGQDVESMAHHLYLHYARRTASWHQVRLKKQPVHYADIFTTGTIALSCIKLLMESSLLLTTQRGRKTPPGCVDFFMLEHVKRDSWLVCSWKVLSVCSQFIFQHFHYKLCIINFYHTF